MGGVVALGECMVELSLAGPGSTGADKAAIGYAGDVFNTCVYLRRLGREVSFATAVGADDPFSAAILARMGAEGIGDSLVTRVEGRVPGLYAIERDADGERRFFYWRDQAPVRQFFQIADLDGFIAAARAAELFYVSGITLAVIGEAGRAALSEILADLARHDVPVAFDPNYRARLWPSREVALAAVEAVIPHCRIVSASGPDVEALCQAPLDETARRWAAKGPLVLARAEDRQVDVHGARSVLTLPAPPAAKATDTTGAGDSFNAGFLAAWLKGAEPTVAVEAGHTLAAQVVQHIGAIIPLEAMPQRQPPGAFSGPGVSEAP
ncbi:sugar kinase [Phenylobacterium sp.]|uniref:sugar kinase n=1 Tax=Phenylobacterium sp. TaxID=1871053 RepID=UPI002C1BD1C8|nr:sugar kinase [Phenylobacterium sp.]HLZ73537.1 sugar kinase [Phenylobacterium sp.]